MIPFIERLGETVGKEWQRRGATQESFSTVAFRALQKSNVHKKFEVEKILKWLCRTKKFPKQLALNNGFGQPPMTLYRHKRLDFLIELYFWVMPEISIHSHGFRGAFTVLRGRSFHCEYAFEVRKNLNQEVLLGNLRLKKATLLRPGDMTEVPQGPAFIHEVWHLGFPSISLLIRTDNWDGPQFTYLKPHLAFRFRHLTPLEIKQTDALLMLHATRSPLEEPYAEKLLSGARLHEGLMYFQKYFEETEDLEQAGRIFSKIPKYRECAPYLLRFFRKAMEIRIDWRRIEGEEERLLLALLYTFQDRESIVGFFESVYPGGKPEKRIFEILRNLTEKQKLSLQLNETAQEILKLLIEGKEEEEMNQTFRKTYKGNKGGVFERDIRSFCRQLSSFSLLAPLTKSPTNKEISSVGTKASS